MVTAEERVFAEDDILRIHPVVGFDVPLIPEDIFEVEVVAMWP